MEIDLLAQSNELLFFLIFLFGLFLFFLLSEYRTTVNYTTDLEKLRSNLRAFPNTDDAELKSLYCEALSTDNNRSVLSEHPAILKNQVPSSRVSFAPSVLTALGVFGTFWGITDGLSGFNSDVLKGDSDATLEQVFGLVEGMKTAFVTSLTGLGLAALTILIFGYLKNRRTNLKEQTMALFERYCVVQTPTLLLSKLLAASSDRQEADREALIASKALGRAAEGMENSMAIMVTSLETFKPEVIGDRVGQALDQSLKPELTGMNTKLESIAKMMKEQNEDVVSVLLEKMRTEVFEPVTQRLDQSASTTKEAAEAVKTLSTELGGVLTSIETFQNKTLAEMNSFTQNLNTTLTEFRTDTKGVLEKVAESVNDTVSAGISAMEKQEVAFAESAKEARKTFLGIKEEMVAALSARAEAERQMLNETREGVSAVLNQAQATFNEQSQTLTTLGTQSAALMETAGEKLVETLSTIDSELNKTVKMVEQELTTFRENYEVSLKAFFDKQNELLEATLGEHKEGLSKVVSEMTSAFEQEYNRRLALGEELRSHFNQLSTITSEIQDLAEAVGLNKASQYSQLTEAASMINREITRLRKQQDDISKQYTDLVQAGDAALLEYTRKANAHNEQFYTNLDAGAAKVMEKLATSAHLLVAGAQESRRSSIEG